ncbi:MULTISPECIES: alpha/beta hydrolase family protein [unclassified Enterococcus]|uniref:alpha/beta hydrolase family protein n=1 Tax=unclassified Enterococcus TaxID=2608891 RepID=UPI001A923452|nr:MULTISPECIES: prolyl oligopeptidase family serine peptidase [unclassified Enterococcus]MBO0460874.1 acetylxylan esterase [Enterococcus sp. DIV1298c]MBO1298629.1 acetylxylan esterase [Enterococcus sp. DIV1271a]
MPLIDYLGRDARSSEPSGNCLSQRVTNDQVIEYYQLTLNDLEPVPAIYVYPTKKEEPLPVVIYLHSHGGDFSLGKSELLKGASYFVEPSFAQALTSMGYGVWTIDAWGFEERGGVAESELFKRFLLTGRTLWGMRLFDVLSLIDYLETREDIDAQRIATIGLSMGGLLSWWTSALDERVKVCIDLAGQVEVESLLKHQMLDCHGYYYYVPDLLTEYTTLAIQQKIAPRKRLTIVGKNDRMCLAEGVTHLNKHLALYYQKLGVPTNFQGYALNGGHFETLEMRSKWQAFLKEQL